MEAGGGFADVPVAKGFGNIAVNKSIARQGFVLGGDP